MFSSTPPDAACTHNCPQTGTESRMSPSTAVSVLHTRCNHLDSFLKFSCQSLTPGPFPQNLWGATQAPQQLQWAAKREPLSEKILACVTGSLGGWDAQPRAAHLPVRPVKALRAPTVCGALCLALGAERRMRSQTPCPHRVGILAEGAGNRKPIHKNHCNQCQRRVNERVK